MSAATVTQMVTGKGNNGLSQLASWKETRWVSRYDQHTPLGTAADAGGVRRQVPASPASAGVRSSRALLSTGLVSNSPSFVT